MARPRSTRLPTSAFPAGAVQRSPIRPSGRAQGLPQDAVRFTIFLSWMTLSFAGYEAGYEVGDAARNIGRELGACGDGRRRARETFIEDRARCSSTTVAGDSMAAIACSSRCRAGRRRLGSSAGYPGGSRLAGLDGALRPYSKRRAARRFLRRGQRQSIFQRKSEGSFVLYENEDHDTIEAAIAHPIHVN